MAWPMPPFQTGSDGAAVDMSWTRNAGKCENTTGAPWATTLTMISSKGNRATAAPTMMQTVASRSLAIRTPCRSRVNTP